MIKTLFKDKKEFDSFIDGEIGSGPSYLSYLPTVRKYSWAEEPKKYPCIAVWEIQYDENGPDMLEYELVYPDDFEL